MVEENWLAACRDWCRKGNTSCDDFFVKSGWHCEAIENGSRKATYISTPITLPGAKPLDFYLFADGENLEFTDDGITVFALRSLGYPLGDKRNWRSLENIATRHGFHCRAQALSKLFFLSLNWMSGGRRYCVFSLPLLLGRRIDFRRAIPTSR